MSRLCPYCSNETAGADPCPWCGGSMGVVQEKRKVAPVIIHDQKESNPWPIAASVFVILVLAVLVFEHGKANQEVANISNANTPNLVVNDHSPLFQSPSSSAPQLARTTSLKTAPPPPVEKADTTTPDDQSDDPADDPLDMPAITPAAGPESVQLSDVQLATQDDDDGHEIAVGSATIYNPSQYEITEYHLYVATAGGTYRLEPFSGSLDRPVPLEVRTIGPGQRITVPIMSNGVITVADDNAVKTVTVEATENGSAVNSSVTLN